ncbi:MAG: hypothetical protein K8I00_12185, partial [Candidatus Omnitrophica bacterium]|nr:hypothetical protein [Candidatus Omnitrophota bacterium]
MELLIRLVLFVAISLCAGLFQSMPAYAQHTLGLYYDADENVVYDESAAEPRIDLPSSPENPMLVRSPFPPEQPANPDPVQPVAVMEDNILTGIPAALAAESVELSFPELYLGKVWSQAVLTTRIGEKGLFAGDFNGNGRVEVIVSNTYYWVVLENNPLNGTYEQVWVSPMYDKLRNYTIYPGIAKMVLYHGDGKVVQKLFTAAVDGHVYRYDLANRVEESAWQAPIADVQSMHIGDGDNDGADELILLNKQEMIFLDPDSGSVKSRIPYGGMDLTVGDADND